MRTQPTHLAVALASLVAGVLGCNGRLAISDETAPAVDAGDDLLSSGRPVDACRCASSTYLTALGCDVPANVAGDLALAPDARPLVTPDGTAAAFVSCRRVETGAGLARCDTIHWTLAGESTRHRGVAAIGISDDGATLLVDAGDELQLIRAGAPPLPLRVELVTGSARLARDGSSVVAISTAGGIASLVRWRQATGVERVGTLDATGADAWHVTDMTPDGSTIIGYSTSGGIDQPFHWTAQGGVQDLGSLPGSVSGARPLAVSEDGSTIAGITTSALLPVAIFRLVAGGEVSALAPAAAGSGPDLGNVQLSSDGLVLAAATTVYGPVEIYRLSQRGEGSLLLPTELPATLADMTADGNVMVGSAAGEGFRWSYLPIEPDPNNPLAIGPGRVIELSEALTAGGMDLTGWALGAPVAVSDDGQLVFGRATCGSVPTLYRAVIPR